jgi:hypothetical protein
MTGKMLIFKNLKVKKPLPKVEEVKVLHLRRAIRVENPKPLKKWLKLTPEQIAEKLERLREKSWSRWKDPVYKEMVLRKRKKVVTKIMYSQAERIQMREKMFDDIHRQGKHKHKNREHLKNRKKTDPEKLKGPKPKKIDAFHLVDGVKVETVVHRRIPLLGTRTKRKDDIS